MKTNPRSEMSVQAQCFLFNSAKLSIIQLLLFFLATTFLAATGLACAVDGGDDQKFDAVMGNHHENNQSLAEGLENMPHEFDFQMTGKEYLLQAVLDTRGLRPPQEAYTLFLETRDYPAMFSVLDSNGEVVTTSKAYAVHDEGTLNARFFSRVQLPADTAAKYEIIGYIDEQIIGARLIFCDEVVYNRADNGSGSLRRAVADVRDGGSVCFDPVEFSDFSAGPVRLFSEVATSKRLSIKGSTHAHVTTNGNNRVFQFNGETVVRRLRLTYGDASEGGLIRTNAAISLRQVSLENGHALYGGALFVASPGSLLLEDSAVCSNESVFFGGGIYVSGPTTIVRSTICANVARDGDRDGQGGGIFLEGDGEFHQTSVSSNTADGYGGGIFLKQGNLSMTENTQINSNQAYGGGGLNCDPPSGSVVSVTIDGASIFNNQAINRGGGIRLSGGDLTIRAGAPGGPGVPEAVSGNTAEYGGGIYAEQDSVVQLRGTSSIWGNTAARLGGGIFAAGTLSLFDQARVTSNTAWENGGGIWTSRQVDFYGLSHVTANTARGFGGGVFMHPSSSVRLWDAGLSTIAFNRSEAGAGGGVYVEGDIGTLHYLMVGEIIDNIPDNVFNP